MKRILPIIVLLLLTTFKMDAQVFAWANGVGGNTGDDAVRGSCVDYSGNVLVVGAFADVATFGPGMTYTSNGGLDIFIAKYDASGNCLWVKTYGSSGTGATANDEAYSVCTDFLGNVYVSGYFQNTVDFDPSLPNTQVLTSLGGPDMFFMKLDVNGTLSFVQQVGGVSQQIGYALKLDAGGNIYVSGAFVGAADFDPSTAGVYTLTGYSTGYDAYLAKYDNNGTFQWANRFGSTSVSGTDNFWNMDIDVLGTIYVIGYFGGTADFDPGPGTANLTASSGNDVVVAEYNYNGEYMHAFRIGGGGADMGRCIKVDNMGSMYITGYYTSASIDFDPGVGTTTLASSNNDIFVAKYDTTGVFSWVRRIGGPGHDHGWQLDLDNSQNVYVTGYFFSSTLSILGPSGTGTGVATISNAGGVSSGTGGTSDGFLVKYDNAGNYKYSYHIGGSTSATDAGYAISIDMTNGAIYTGGAFSGTVDMNFSTAVNTVNANGGTDAYLAKYGLTPLPVTMSKLNAAWRAQTIALNWETYTEKNISGFEVERSVDGITFSKIGFVKNKEVAGRYEFIDKTPTAVNNFYRVKVIEIDGQSTYSNTVMLTSQGKQTQIQLFPNPVSNSLNIAFGSQPGDYMIAIMSVAGQLLLQNEYKVEDNEVKEINVQHLPTGIYFVEIASKDQKTTLRFVKSH